MAKSKEEPGTEIANWDEELAKYADAGAAAETPSSSYLSLKSGILSMGGQPVPNNKLDGIILDAAYENTFYTEKYDANNLRTPACFALAQITGDPEVDADIGPHPDSADPQSDKCADCPRMKWRSDLWGGKGKACQERRRLLVIPADVVAEEANAHDKIISAEVAVLKIPVMSVKYWGSYVQTLKTIHKRPPFAMVTTLSTEPDAKSQFRLTYTPKAEIVASLTPSLLAKRKASETILLKPYDAEESGEGETAAPKENTKHGA